MGHRLSKIYTRTGDEGTTGLGDGTRVSKDHPRVEAYGTVDETNSAIGVILAVPGITDDIRRCLTDVQHDLFDLGGELCIPGCSVIEESYVTRLENELDALNDPLPPLEDFILPGGGPASAACHVARTTCRRAERQVWTLSTHEPVNEFSLKYLNRLSDLLFVMARTVVRHERGGEVLWEKARNRGRPA